MPKILRNKLFRNWFGHPVQSLRSLCSLILQCRILKSWIRARINECMSYCTKMNEWPFFIIITTRSTMQTFAKFKIVVLCISVSFYWDLINDWISMMRWYFFFCSAYCIWMESISSTVSIICSMSILGNATYSELSRRTEITPLEHIAQKEQNWRQLQSRIFLHQMRIEQCIYSRMRSL